MTDLAGARTLVTGATGGLGRAICKALRAEGADLVVSGRQAVPLGELALSLGAAAVAADLSVRADLWRLLAEAGEVDVLVANAGLPGSGDVAGFSEEELDRALQVNLVAPMQMTRALLPGMRSRGRGHLVFVSSVAGIVSSPNDSVYAATKFGLRGFAGGLRCDLHGSPIGCSVVLPGLVRGSGMFADAGVEPPTGVGTVTPGQVARAVVRAIRANRAETVVAAAALRALAVAGGLFPGLAAPVQARLDRGLSESIARAQTGKR